MAQPPDPTELARALLRALKQSTESNRELIEAVERQIGKPEPKVTFIPTDMQQSILAALAGKALRTDAIAHKVGCARSSLFKDPGGLPELQEEGLVTHHRRLGYYRADAPPPDAP